MQLVRWSVSLFGTIAIVSAVFAAATIWLLLTDPVTVADAVDTGQVSPLVKELATVLYNALGRAAEVSLRSDRQPADWQPPGLECRLTTSAPAPRLTARRTATLTRDRRHRTCGPAAPSVTARCTHQAGYRLACRNFVSTYASRYLNGAAPVL